MLRDAVQIANSDLDMDGRLGCSGLCDTNNMFLQ